METLRQERGWSYAELARRMGVSRSYVQRLAQGNENSTIVSLCKLAAALDCEVEISFKPKAAAKARAGSKAGSAAKAADKPAGVAKTRPAAAKSAQPKRAK